MGGVGGVGQTWEAEFPSDAGHSSAAAGHASVAQFPSDAASGLGQASVARFPSGAASPGQSSAARFLSDAAPESPYPSVGRVRVLPQARTRPTP